MIMRLSNETKPTGLARADCRSWGRSEVAPFGGSFAGDRSYQGALADLAGTVDQYYSGVGERVCSGSAPGHERETGHIVDLTQLVRFASLVLTRCDWLAFGLRKPGRRAM